MGKVETKEVQKRYPVKCCVCGHEFSATMSIMQLWGYYDNGCGSCPECGKFLNLTYVPQEEKMVSKKWDDYITEIKEIKNDKK